MPRQWEIDRFLPNLRLQSPFTLSKSSVFGRAECAADLDGVQPVGSPAPVERDIALAEEGNHRAAGGNVAPQSGIEGIGSESAEAFAFSGLPAVIFERHSRSR